MKRMKKKNLQFELIMKISIYFVLFVILVSSSVLIIETVQYHRVIVEGIENNMHNKISSVDSIFADVKTPLVMLARHSSAVSSMEHYDEMDNREKLESRNTLNELMQNIATFKDFISDLIIVGERGFLYNLYNGSSDKYLKNFEFDDHPWFHKAADGGQRLYYMGEHSTEYYLSGQENVYSVVLPVYQRKNRIGFIICDIYAEAVDQILTEGLDENKAKLFVYDEEGILICEKGKAELTEEVPFTEDTEREGILYFLRALFSNDSLITKVASDVTGWTYVYAEPYSNFNGFLRTVILLDVLFILVGLVVITFFVRQTNRQIVAPLKNILYMLQDMKINQGTEEITSARNNTQNLQELGIEIEMMLQRMDKLISDNYVYALQAKDAQIQVLVNQLSPHFLYNTLQLIEYQSYVKNQENVSKIISSLSYILRYAISTATTVRLEEELKYIRAYLEIYRLRYENKLTYEICVEETIDEARIVPKMILEPVVENCMKHGFEGIIPDARIRISIENQDGLVISVSDNGKGMDEQQLEALRSQLEKPAIRDGHIGLNNINSILRLQYGPAYGILIFSQKNEGTRVEIHLPGEDCLPNHDIRNEDEV